MENSQRLPSSNSDKEALYAEWEQWKENEPPDEKRAEAVSRMRKCYEENAKNLDLSSMALSQLPTLPDCVQYLIVDNNQLTQLPALPGSLEKLSASNNQLTQLPALPGSLKELSVRDNQLTRLPALPSSLEGLFVNNNQLIQLPTLPDFLKKLYVYDNRLTELLVLPRSLKELYIRDNQLTQLPELPNSLEKLSVSNNPLTQLRALPSSLKKLLANNNQLTQLSELPDSLEELQADHNQLTRLPVLPGSLKTLSVHNNELTYLPTLPSSLNRLLVANNRLTQLPPTIMALSSNSFVSLDNNPLSERTRQDLQLVTHDGQGPRFSFSMSEGTIQAPVQSIEEIIAEWYPSEQCAEMEQRWRGIAKEEGAEPFLGFLSRLAHTVNSKHTPFRQFVSDWLSLLSTEPRLRQHSFLIAKGATESCEDRVSWVFNEMQKIRVTHEVENGVYDSQLPLLVSKAREMFRLECLEKLAREKVKTLRFVDEIEVYLAYQVELREPLQLSSAIKKMRFLGAAHVTPDDLEIALLNVKHRENSEFTAWLSRWSPWESVLERLYNSPYQSAMAQLHDEDAFTTRLTATLQQLNLADNDYTRQKEGPKVMAKRSDEIKIPLTRDFLQQHQLSELLDNVWNWKDEQGLALGSQDSPALHREAVNSWKIQDVNPRGSKESHRFAAPLVLQLEDNPTVRKAAAKLAGKYPGRSVLVQLDAEGRYRVVYGDPGLLRSYLRWQVVGHGRRDERAKHEQTLGGSDALTLASQIARLSQRLNDDYSINSQPGYISLVGCSLAERDATTSYAHQLALSLDRQGIRADIAARRTAVMVSQR